MITDNRGKELAKAESLGSQRLQRGDDVIVSKDQVIWFAGEADKERLIAHVLQP
jgi:hypothetical protein